MTSLISETVCKNTISRETSKEGKMIEQHLAGDYLDIAKVQDEEQEAILSRNNVVGVAVGHKIKKGKETGDPCLAVLVSQKLPPELLTPDDLVPDKAGKFPTDVIETGILFAGGGHSEAKVIPEQEEIGIQALRRRVRPVEGGYSVGHYAITAGTYATAVIDRDPYPGIPRKYYVLSNNHVLANSNAAKIGDGILQPGVYDGGRFPGDVIARLSRFVPIKFDGSCNYVDAAIAEGAFEILDREIYWIGYVKGVAAAQLGMIVQKTGRTTHYTTGRVTGINATVMVNYGGGRTAKMCRQIVTTNMSAGGDSGSLLCDMQENAVGLLFAGSSAATIHNDIRYVQALLRIRIV
jgi:hypothetical protein